MQTLKILSAFALILGPLKLRPSKNPRNKVNRSRHRRGRSYSVQGVVAHGDGKDLEAAHLINEEYKKKKELQVSEVTDIQYLSNFGKKQHEKKIIQIITDSVKPKRIYTLCNIDADSQREPKYDYLVVVPENSPQSFDDIKELIENVCLELPPISVSFVKENQFSIDLGN